MTNERRTRDISWLLVKTSIRVTNKNHNEDQQKIVRKRIDGRICSYTSKDAFCVSKDDSEQLHGFLGANTRNLRIDRKVQSKADLFRKVSFLLVSQKSFKDF